MKTRIIEMPVFYDDPWTRETLMRCRERHQDPGATDLEYTARINGYPDVPSLIAAHDGSPWFVSTVGFVADLPFLYQMVARDKQIQAPKYLRPRTDTPKLTVGNGGCFGAIYSVRGAGGYQISGITPMPIYDPAQQISSLRDFMIPFRPGDMVKFRPIGRDAYDAAVGKRPAGRRPTVKAGSTSRRGAWGIASRRVRDVARRARADTRPRLLRPPLRSDGSFSFAGEQAIVDGIFVQPGRRS